MHVADDLVLLMILCCCLFVQLHQLNSGWSEARKASYVKHAVREYNIHKALRHVNIVSLTDIFEVGSPDMVDSPSPHGMVENPISYDLLDLICWGELTQQCYREHP
jgi:serine/threonine protein kinase